MHCRHAYRYLLAAVLTFLAGAALAQGIGIGIGLDDTAARGIGKDVPPTVTIFNRDGVSTVPTSEIALFDVAGDKVDLATLTQITQVGSTFYYYGLASGCGFRINVAGVPYCGVNIYSSPDLINLTFVGTAFDPNSDSWQTNCFATSGPSGLAGCYVPRVIYNAANNNYVMWMNSNYEGNSYDVLTSASPAGPFVKGTPPSHMAITTGGDEALFVDANGTGYVVYETTGAGQIHIDQLNAGFTDSDGTTIAPAGISGDTPFLFGPVSGVYHLLWSGACALCSGAAIHHATASSVQGTWTIQSDISADACGGQFNGAYPLTINSSPVYLLASGLLGLATTVETDGLGFLPLYFQPLSFTGSTLNSITCQNSVTISGLGPAVYTPTTPTPDQGDEAAAPGFGTWCDVTSSVFRLQEFVPSRSYSLQSVALPIGRSSAACGSGCSGPNGALTVSIVSLTGDVPNATLASAVLTAASISWAPTRTIVTFSSPPALTGGTKYAIKLSGANTVGCYGTAYSYNLPYSAGVERVSSNSGTSWTTDANASLRFAVNNPACASNFVFDWSVATGCDAITAVIP